MDNKKYLFIFAILTICGSVGNVVNIEALKTLYATCIFVILLFFYVGCVMILFAEEPFDMPITKTEYLIYGIIFTTNLIIIGTYEFNGLILTAFFAKMVIEQQYFRIV